MKTVKIFVKSEKTSNYTYACGALLSCKRQFSCHFHETFNSLEIRNTDVCLIHLHKYIFATNYTTNYSTATGKETPKIGIFGYCSLFLMYLPPEKKF